MKKKIYVGRVQLGNGRRWVVWNHQGDQWVAPKSYSRKTAYLTYLNNHRIDLSLVTLTTYKDVMRAYLIGGVEGVKRLSASKDSVLRAMRALKVKGKDVADLETLMGRRVRGRQVTPEGELHITRKVQQQRGGKPFLHVVTEEAGFEGGKEVLIVIREGEITIRLLGEKDR